MTTSGILGTLALTVFAIFIFQWGAEKEAYDHPDKPISQVVYDLPDER